MSYVGLIHVASANMVATWDTVDDAARELAGTFWADPDPGSSAWNDLVLYRDDGGDTEIETLAEAGEIPRWAQEHMQ